MSDPVDVNVNVDVDFSKLISTEAGLKLFIKIRDLVAHVLRTYGAFRTNELLDTLELYGTTNFEHYSVLDKLVELHEIECVTPALTPPYRVYVAYWAK